MSIKERLKIILKILLIFIFIPVSVKSLADDSVINATMSETSNTSAGRGFKDSSLLYENQTKVNSGYSVNSVINAVNDAPLTALNKYESVFCLKRGINAYNWKFEKSTTFPSSINTSPTDPNIDGSTITDLDKAPQTPWTWPPVYNEKIKNSPLINQVDLGSITNFNAKYGGKVYAPKNSTFNAKYAISFYKRTDESDYKNSHEEVQQAIWGYTGLSEAIHAHDDMDDDSMNLTIEEDLDSTPEYKNTKLYVANKAFVAAEKIIKNHPMTNISLSTDKAELGSYMNTAKDSVVIGPFTISDHAYAEDKNGLVSEYSGKDLTKYKNCIAGLLDCEVTYTKDNNTSGTLKSSDSDFKICYTKTGNENCSKNTGYVTSKYLKVPEQYTSNKVPYPDQEFYIKIPITKVNSVNLKKVTGLKLTARVTESTGTGKTWDVQYNDVNWTLQHVYDHSVCNQCGAEFNDANATTHTHNNLHCKEPDGYALPSGSLAILHSNAGSNHNYFIHLVKSCFPKYYARMELVYGATQKSLEIKNIESQEMTIGEKKYTVADLAVIFDRGSKTNEDPRAFLGAQVNPQPTNKYIVGANSNIDENGNQTFPVCYFTDAMDDLVDDYTHTHKPTCYYSNDIACEYSTTHSNHYWDERQKSDPETLKWFSQPNGHTHTTACYPVEVTSPVTKYYRHYYETPNESNVDHQPLLIVDTCETKVYTKDTTLNIDVPITDVHIDTWINSLWNGGIQHKNDIENINDLDTNDNGTDRKASSTWTETTKKEKPVLTEAGDTLNYWIKITNNKAVATNIQLETQLPSTIEKDGNYYKFSIKKIDENGNAVEPGSGVIQNSEYGTSTSTSSTISTQYFPGAFAYNNKYYVTVPANGTIRYRIAVIIDTAKNSYNTSSPKELKTKILGTYRADVASTDPYYNNAIANIALANSKHKTESSDYYVCKKYNLKLNSAITDMYRTDSTTHVDSGSEKIVDNDQYKFNDNARLNIGSDIRSTNPLYVENGDCISYQIRLKNDSNDSSPYYRPNTVYASVKVTKPTNTAECIGISSQDTTTTNSVGTFTYNSTTEMINEWISVERGHEVIVWVTFRINSSKTTKYDYNTLREIKAELIDVKNINNRTTSSGKIVNTASSTELTSSDYYRIKEYNVVVDKYITKVEHLENRGGTTTTYDSQGRRVDISDPTYGTENPSTRIRPITNYGGIGAPSGEVSVEYGDKVTYTIAVYNTTNNNYYNVGRDGAPYKAPQNITVNLKDTLPINYSDLTYSGATGTLNDAKTEITFSDVPVAAGDISYITVSLVVEDVTKDTIRTNSIEINGDVKNINSYSVINNGNRNSASDKYKLNNYSATLDEYVNVYNAEMAKYNNANGFTKDESEGFSNGTEANNSYPNERPLDLEKYETLTYATKVTNTSSGGIAESVSDNYAKYNTRVRPTDVKITLDDGLQYVDYRAIWYNATGVVKEDITKRINSYSTENTQVITYNIDANNEDIILEPGECIIYYTDVKVLESNLSLDNLGSKSEIVTLSNVNRDLYKKIEGVMKGAEAKERAREVTAENISSKKEDSDYVRLKDVVIAGNVWLDTDQDGYKGNSESGKAVTVKLYKSNGSLVATTISGSANVTFNNMSNTSGTTQYYSVNGTASETTNIASGTGNYSFGRVWKATNKDANKNYTSNASNISYYVEFEYDGIKYKATDVYGGDNDGDADGMQNLSGKQGSTNWRQGYSDLVDTKSGEEKYMKDSNAYEFDDVRNNFDAKYQTIGYNKSYYTSKDANGNNVENDSIGMTYTKDGHISTLDENTNTNRIMKARSFITQKISDQNGISQSKDNTNLLFLANYDKANAKTEEITLTCYGGANYSCADGWVEECPGGTTITCDGGTRKHCNGKKEKCEANIEKECTKGNTYYCTAGKTVHCYGGTTINCPGPTSLESGDGTYYKCFDCGKSLDYRRRWL